VRHHYKQCLAWIRSASRASDDALSGAGRPHDETKHRGGTGAADLIGQLADPLYLRRLNALYYEFLETGMAERCGYTSPADMIEKYPAFFWENVEPYIGDALGYLELTIEGKQWIANLYSHVFTIEHARRRLGPHVAAKGGERA
jgi:hypothetical protein